MTVEVSSQPVPADPAAPPTDLVLGPLLRRVEGDQATIWVETGHPATVEIKAVPPGARPSDASASSGAASGGPRAGGAARTFSAYGHHYALVVVDNLPAASTTPYEVLVDGVVVWPRADDPYPPPAIRTRAPGAPVRLVFGSCREATPYSVKRYPPDALDAYAVRLADTVRERASTAPTTAPWPDLLVLLGDQVYADQTPKRLRQWLKRRRRRPDAPAAEVVDFHEYTKLYLDSWTDPEIRWLLSNVPSTMIFDDHEIIDDWNSSASWRADIAQQGWWGQRIQAGLASYWVYQHLGNLAPAALAEDPLFAAVASAGDATAILAEFGARADRERGSYRWSYALDIDRTRLIVLDNRAGRELAPGRRSMLTDTEWAWFARTVPGDYDHLVIGSSLPWLMPPAIHHLEAVSERLAESPSRPVAAFGEKLRRAVDLEHWAAFGRSFDALSALLGQIGTPAADGTSPPATISVLSGDVHHSYAARAYLGPDVTAAVHQLTCSPVHNDVPRAIRPAMRFGWNASAARVMRGLARSLGVRRPVVRWRKLAGPYFGNAISQLVHNGRSATVIIEGTRQDKTLTPVATVELRRQDR
jgi:hypothetical protein